LLKDPQVQFAVWGQRQWMIKKSTGNQRGPGEGVPKELKMGEKTMDCGNGPTLGDKKLLAKRKVNPGRDEYVAST